MIRKPPPKAEIVDVKNYPAMLTEKAAAEFARVLTNGDTMRRVGRVVELRRDELTDAVRDYIVALESAMAAGDLKTVYAQAHEIRGLAGTAGLDATGKIADGLCKYIDAAERLNAPAENAVMGLHIDAIARASSAAAEARTYGARVATELGALVARKLQAINELKTKSA